jgi:hypothetical protein
MKKSYIVLLMAAAFLMLNSFSANSQEVKLTKEEKKAQKKAALEYNFKILDSLFTTKKFILVGDYALANGERTTLNQAMSYVIVNDPKGIIYSGSNYNTTGVPREGSIGVYKVSKSEKNLSFTVEFDINSPLGRFDVLMDVLATNLITATISGQSLPSFTWEGHIETLQKIKVFKVIN